MHFLSCAIYFLYSPCFLLPLRPPSCMLPVSPFFPLSLFSLSFLFVYPCFFFQVIIFFLWPLSFSYPCFSSQPILHLHALSCHLTLTLSHALALILSCACFLSLSHPPFSCTHTPSYLSSCGLFYLSLRLSPPLSNTLSHRIIDG